MISLKPILVAAALLAVSAMAARAETATAWNEHPNSRVRLIAGEDRIIGVELQLAPGWKTYWRMPGDAGVPPSFEWAGSENVKGFDVLYPAPISMSDQGGTAIGYKGSVIFPVQFERGSNGAARVALEFSYGVCKDVCIPVDSTLSLTLPPLGGPPSATLKTALTLVPRPTTEPAQTTPGLVSSAYDLGGASPHITLKTRGAADVFVEAPDGLFVPLTKKKDEKDGIATYVVDLSKSPDLKDLAGQRLRVTVTAPNGNGGIEATLLLK